MMDKFYEFQLSTYLKKNLFRWANRKEKGN